MIPLEKHYFVYTGYMNTPPSGVLMCALCKAKPEYTGKRAEIQGWVAFHVNHHTRERYCPECAVKVWPELYSAAMKSLESEQWHPTSAHT